MLIGKQLKKIRARRGLILDEVAKLTGVSKPMLGQIERGKSSPTINILWKIATGLKIPLSELLREEKTEYSVTSPEEGNLIVEENGAMRAFALFPYDPIRNFEAFYIEFDGGCVHDSDGHSDNVEETVFVISGRLDVVINDRKVTLDENRAVRFSANVPHSYQNNYQKICRIYNTIFY